MKTIKDEIYLKIKIYKKELPFDFLEKGDG